MPPKPSGAFYWTQERWGLALCCTPLEPIARHLFTTRQLALRGPDDDADGAWPEVAKALQVDPRDVLRLRQVHGARVVAVRLADRFPDPRPQADVLMTDDPSRAVAVQVADCVPLLIADPDREVVAAVHAGWRGAAAGAARAAVRAMADTFGSRASDLVAALGPSIGPCCYRVGSELIDAFRAAGHPEDAIDRWFPRPARQGASTTSTLHLDLWAANRDQLVDAGMQPANIHASGLCTACRTDVFYSFRVEGPTGRMVGVIRRRQ